MENESLQMEQTEEVVNPQESGEAAEQGSEGEKSSGDAGRSQQTHEDNRRYQAARRSGEEAGYQRAVREMNQRIARAGMRSPATGEIIGDIDGLESFAGTVRKQRIAEKAKREGRPEAEVEEEEANREFVSQSRREAAEKKKADEEAARQCLFVRFLHHYRFPVHDHCRKNLGWSDPQVLIRFMLLQTAIMPLVIIVMIKLR